jgi:hypothetical protein
MSVGFAVKPRTRLLGVMPWAIASLPLILLGLTWAVGLWPNPVAVALQIVAVYALVIWDTKLLVRLGIHLSWFSALRTPVPYLRERARRTGVAKASAWAMLFSVIVWIAALIPALLTSIDHESRHGDLRLASVWSIVTTENHDYLQASSEWGATRANASITDLAQRASDYREALTSVETVVDVSYFPADQQESVDNIVDQANRVAALVEQTASAATQEDLGGVGCQQTLAIRDLNEALLDYLIVSENPQADRVADEIEISRSMAELCLLTMKADAARYQLTARMGLDAMSTQPDDLEAFATSIDAALPRLRQQDWPTELDPASVSAISDSYEELSASAFRWSSAVRRGDDAAAESESRLFHRELRTLDTEQARQTAEYYQAILGAANAG